MTLERTALRTALAALAAVVLLGPVKTHASSATYSPEAIALARVCVSEAGWTYDGDCAAIHAVLRFHSIRRDLSFLQFARRYSDRVFDRRRSDSRRWIAWLSPTFEQPRGWPRRVLTWERGAELWRERLEHAEEIVRGEVEPECDRPPHHWGARYGVDKSRAERAIEAGRWRMANCGRTRNAFYHVRGLRIAAADEAETETETETEP
jgi:hypothetical protein